MAAVDTPYPDRLRWSEHEAIAVHGRYRVTGRTGPCDVFYTSDATGETTKLATGIRDPYHFCVDHNKETLRIARLNAPAPSSHRPRHVVGRNEKTCQECGSIHAGEC